jgi:hypothetical protein
VPVTNNSIAFGLPPVRVPCKRPVIVTPGLAVICHPVKRMSSKAILLFNPFDFIKLFNCLSGFFENIPGRKGKKF